MMNFKRVKLERQLEFIQVTELEIKNLEAELEVLKYKRDDRVEKKLMEMMDELEEQQGKIEVLEALNQELYDDRQKLIMGFREILRGSTLIGVKRIGELDKKTFYSACVRKFSAEDALVKSVELHSLWQFYLDDPNWLPYRVDTSGDKTMDIINDDDEKLKELRSVWGSDVYTAVTNALKEVKIYNPCGRYAFEELWNFSKGTKATLVEVVQYILTKLEAETDRHKRRETDRHKRREPEVDDDAMEKLKKELDDKVLEISDLEDLNQALLLKEWKSSFELYDAYKEFIKGFKDMMSGSAVLGIKVMGDLDHKPFKAACAKKYSPKEAGFRATTLCSIWEDHIKDLHWHPYKIVTDGDKIEEILNEDDEKLKELKNDWGEDVFKAVVTALNEMKEYNPSGRYLIEELWNFKEGRKATLKEAAQYVLKQWKTKKRMRKADAIN